jgi:hypothetical protein
MKEQPRNGLSASSKAILTWVTLRSSEDNVVHLVGYGGDYPFLHCQTGGIFKRGIKNLPEPREAVVNNGVEYIID